MLGLRRFYTQFLTNSKYGFITYKTNYEGLNGAHAHVAALAGILSLVTSKVQCQMLNARANIDSMVQLYKEQFPSIIRSLTENRENDEIEKGASGLIIKQQDKIIKLLRADTNVKASFISAQQEYDILNYLAKCGYQQMPRFHQLYSINGFSFIQEEYLSNYETFFQVIKVLYSSRMAFSQEQQKIITQNARMAVSQLHQCNVVHLDIKPDNIMINLHSFDVKIIDFNSAKDVESLQMHNYAYVVGYYAPHFTIYQPSLTFEQARCLDNYALAVSLYEMFNLQRLDGQPLSKNTVTEAEWGHVIERKGVIQEQCQQNEFLVEMLCNVIAQ